MSLIIHCKYKYFDSTVQRAEDRRQKCYFCRLPFAVNVKLNLPNDDEGGGVPGGSILGYVKYCKIFRQVLLFEDR